MIYILCRLSRAGSCSSEEILKACTAEGKEALIEYAEQYHMDVLEDIEDMGDYRGLVIYETDENSEPFVSHEWNLE